MAGVAFAVEGDGVGFATESYAASALYTTLASLSGALWRIRRARGGAPTGKRNGNYRHGTRTKEAMQAIRYVNLLSRLARKS